ncbi:uncharacterized protein UV8b_03766 [Ustilaginoidea virens]|uniref:Uncharacterized protein n=1 Tax=Ustilaginoidea virens TaxID=1159556 RepID=A0A8E5HPX8_USTVR|nr:uncharacterized protein UV8b_03766 [Ustilaginoidea virens]QUC19525.1 hypothetical protein UV8b_03766 [Ustilaginoidea virens]
MTGQFPHPPEDIIIDFGFLDHGWLLPKTPNTIFEFILVGPLPGYATSTWYTGRQITCYNYDAMFCMGSARCQAAVYPEIRRTRTFCCITREERSIVGLSAYQLFPSLTPRTPHEREDWSKPIASAILFLCRLSPAACRLPPAACRLPPAACRTLVGLDGNSNLAEYFALEMLLKSSKVGALLEASLAY